MALTATVHESRLELREPLGAADRLHGSRRSLFLELRVAEAVGWAECAVSEEPGPDPTTDEVLVALGDRVLGLALRAAQSDRGDAPVLAQVSRRRAAVAAAALADAAVVDLRLRAEGRSLAHSLGATATSVGFAGVVGIADPARARGRAAELVALGATRLRVKVGPRDGVDAVRAVLDEVLVPVVADANGSLVPGRDDAVLDALCELPLAWLEQPFAPANLAAHAELAASRRVSVGLDESVRSARSIRDIARYGAASTLCCKPARLGGIARTIEARRAASELGLATYVGGFFEAGLGRAVLGALAAAHEGDLDGDVVAPATYLVSDPCGLPGPSGGRQPLHLAPGCGPVPDPARLSALMRAEG